MAKNIVPKIIGFLILTLSLFFLWKNFDVSTLQCLKKLEAGKVLTYFLIATPILAFCTFIESDNWKFILFKLSGKKISSLQLYRAYCSANLSKYIPGNFAHLVMRNFLVRKHGLSHLQIGFATILEVLFVIFTSIVWCTIFILTGMVKMPIEINTFSDPLSLPAVLTIGIAVFIALLLLLMLIYRAKLKAAWRNFDAEKILRIIKTSALRSFFVFSITLFLLAFTFVIGYKLLYNINLTSTQSFYIAGIVISAWVIGMITPGVSAGIGVRESICVLFLGPRFGMDITLIVAIINRLTCVLNDCFSFLFSLLIIYSGNSKRHN